jgi:hypothetical protein
MRLIHHSAEPFEFDREYTYDKQHLTSAVGKPHGLWLSDESGDDGWRSWCEGEEFHLAGLDHETEFVLAPGHNVLVIETAEALSAFDREFKPDVPGVSSIMGLDWDKVRARYDGIIISPYQYAFRFGLMWYYGWDCASGCIWNLSAIEPVSRRTERTVIPGGYTETSS